MESCPSGTFGNNITRSCDDCPSSCVECDSFVSCTECWTGYTLSNTNQCDKPNITCDV